MEPGVVRTKEEIEQDHRAARRRAEASEWGKEALQPQVMLRVLAGTLLPEQSPETVRASLKEAS